MSKFERPFQVQEPHSKKYIKVEGLRARDMDSVIVPRMDAMKKGELERKRNRGWSLNWMTRKRKGFEDEKRKEGKGKVRTYINYTDFSPRRMIPHPWYTRPGCVLERRDLSLTRRREFERVRSY
ncbi:hypothetical protein ONS95_004714 [Cadophora gregata]|uniref:uncharacterized protein n=1 Tax=Cadophora gregata TaxID=51156 RepID=UPI0026DBF89D|nr:uncharacterized protein ONS95_004714 [Cadophora gregata]KAK0104421.1 hypothetical protein ONS95_004714 [Cadophora gregata]